MATRGSDKLRQRLGSRCTFDPDQIEKVIGVLREHDFKIVDWECHGQPQPDFFRGALEVEPERLGEATQVLGLGLGQRVGLEAFPCGIPFPDLFRVEFESLGHGG